MRRLLVALIALSASMLLIMPSAHAGPTAVGGKVYRFGSVIGLGGVSVTVYAVGAGDPTATTATADDGSWSFNADNTTNYEVSYSKPGFAPRTRVAIGNDINNHVDLAPNPRALSGTVVDADTGAEVGGIDVNAVGSAFHSFATRADVHGVFSETIDDGQSYTLMFSDRNGVYPDDAQPEHDPPATYRLKAADGMYFGKATDAATTTALAGVAVGVGGDLGGNFGGVVTDDDGNYQVSVPADQTYTLTFTKAGYDACTAHAPIQAPAAFHIVNCALTASTGGGGGTAGGGTGGGGTGGGGTDPGATPTAAPAATTAPTPTVAPAATTAPTPTVAPAATTAPTPTVAPPPKLAAAKLTGATAGTPKLLFKIVAGGAKLAKLAVKLPNGVHFTKQVAAALKITGIKFTGKLSAGVLTIKLSKPATSVTATVGTPGLKLDPPARKAGVKLTLTVSVTDSGGSITLLKAKLATH